MADDSAVKKLQGKVPPRLFVGLGGTGSRIVDRVAERAKFLPHWEEALRPLTAFVSIDTDVNDQNLLSNIPRGNRIPIGAFDKHQAVENYRRAGDQKALQWLDKAYQPRAGGGFGAGQIRVESRLGFHYSSPAIRERFFQILRALLEANNTFRLSNPPTIYVYVYSTLAGGTGSGSFLCSAYLLQDVINALHWRPRIIGNFMLSTTMLNMVDPDLHPDIHANTYAALKELEHMTGIQYPEVQKDLPNGETFVYWNNPSASELSRVRTAPFYYSSLYDVPQQMSIPDMQNAVSDATFWQAFTPIINQVFTEADNYEKHLKELTRFPGELRNLGRGYTKNFGAFGLATLLLPADDLLEYCAQRFAAEALRRQITFGVDPNATDDRARALERNRVNYDDPKFRNMAEDDRYREINKAFVLSVQSMAAQDKKEQEDERSAGYWQRLVEEVDEGRKTGTDEKGNELRAETLVSRVRRILEEEREPIVKRIDIKVKPFHFQRENYNQYMDHINRLNEDARKSGIQVEEGIAGLRASAAEGDAVQALKLDPMQERYLVLRLLELIETEWLPQANSRVDETRSKSLENSKVKERVESGNLEQLKDAAGAKKFGFFADREGFDSLRDGMQTEFQKVRQAQTRYLEAQMEAAQFRSLLDYLQKRSKLYARLANRMNDLVQDLEAEAEGLRRGANPRVPKMTLSVEVFETMNEPRERIWRQVYHELFVAGGAEMSTYDRKVLSHAISEELKPERDPSSGRFVEKNESKAVVDLRRALLKLGRTRLSAKIYGTDESSPLTLEQGIRLEGRILLPRRGNEPPSEQEVDQYVDRKLVAFSQVAGVLARVRTEELESRDDGVTVSRTRHLAFNEKTASPGFAQRMRRILERDGRSPKDVQWESPHLAIAHDMLLPIPLYYFGPVVGEIENAYEQVAANERRGYHLHTDYHWEMALPNLNPEKSELTVGWALQRLIDGMLTQIIVKTAEGLYWPQADGAAKQLGESLSEALFTLGEYNANEDLGPTFERKIKEAKTEIGLDQLRERASVLKKWAGQRVLEIALAAREGATTRGEELDLPVLRVMQSTLGRMLGESGNARPSLGKPAAEAPPLRSEIDFGSSA